LAKAKTTRPNTAGRKAAQAKYNSKPAQVKRRTERNAARRTMVKAGKVRKGDGKDVHHKNHNTSDNSKANLAAVGKRTNRNKNY
jgi:hypothetical protein